MNEELQSTNEEYRVEGSVAAATISHRVNAERIVLIGWIRALLLQIAHPLIAAGVREHSSFRGSAGASFRRLRQTVDAMLAITFGTSTERAQSLDDIRVVHRRVHGRLSEPCGVFPAGTRYSAEDSELLVWVHATLVESILLVYEMLVAPLSPAERDRYCADGADVAVELGARADAVPRSWSTVRAYVADGCTGRTAVGTDARALATVLLSPIRFPVARHILTPMLSLIAAGLLPVRVRQQYGIAWSRRRARRFTRLMQLIRVMRRAAPARLALWRCARSAACCTENWSRRRAN
jgi:uncharacterized protein (DUF2236 family)